MCRVFQELQEVASRPPVSRALVQDVCSGLVDTACIAGCRSAGEKALAELSYGSVAEDRAGCACNEVVGFEPGEEWSSFVSVGFEGSASTKEMVAGVGAMCAHFGPCLECLFLCVLSYPGHGRVLSGVGLA